MWWIVVVVYPSRYVQLIFNTLKEGAHRLCREYFIFQQDRAKLEQYSKHNILDSKTASSIDFSLVYLKRSLEPFEHLWDLLKISWRKTLLCSHCSSCCQYQLLGSSVFCCLKKLQLSTSLSLFQWYLLLTDRYSLNDEEWESALKFCPVLTYSETLRFCNNIVSALLQCCFALWFGFRWNSKYRCCETKTEQNTYKSYHIRLFKWLFDWILLCIYLSVEVRRLSKSKRVGFVGVRRYEVACHRLEAAKKPAARKSAARKSAFC